MNIVVTGSIAYDYLMSFPGDFLEHIKPERLQKLSLSFLVDDMRKQRGGCAPNIAYTLALLGERPLLMGTAGKDFGAYRNWLEAQGVDTSAVRVIPEAFTASFFATTDRRQNQIASFYTGAMTYARELSFHDLERPVDLTIISPNDPVAMDLYPEECRELGIPYIYDPSQQVVRSTPESLHNGLVGADMLVVNDYEYELLKERVGMTDAQVRQAVITAVIVTRGKEGATIWVGDEEIRVPAAPERRILDPTGVGDAFRAGLIKGLALGLPWGTAGRIGSLAATYVLETDGPQAHHYTLAEFAARYVDTFGEDEFTQAVLS
ncbi:MAG: carbohydrate kinase family protein [Anaerolineae bacterium]